MDKIIHFWQTEKDFKEFLKVIEDAGAELVSSRGDAFSFESKFCMADFTENDAEELLEFLEEESAMAFGDELSFENLPQDANKRYINYDYSQIYLTDFYFSRIFIKGKEIPIESNEKYRWVSPQAECLSYNIPAVDKANSVILNGSIGVSDPAKKNKEYIALYKKLIEFIKRNYKLSKDKFAYAGPDFLSEWQKGKLLACNGPVRDVEKYAYKAEFE